MLADSSASLDATSLLRRCACLSIPDVAETPQRSPTPLSGRGAAQVTLAQSPFPFPLPSSLFILGPALTRDICLLALSVAQERSQVLI
jgi:hypothetical protein